MENNNRDFEPIEPLDISRHRNPSDGGDGARNTDRPDGAQPQDGDASEARAARGHEAPTDGAENAGEASDGSGEAAAPRPDEDPGQANGAGSERSGRRKGAPLTDEEKAERRKKRLTLSGRIARSTLWYPLRITLFILCKAITYLLNIFFTVLIVGMITGVVVGCAFLVYIKGYIDPNYDGLDNLKFDSSLNTTISCIDPETGREETMVTLHGSENRMWAEYSEFPDTLINAFIAIEDVRFFSHNGVDIKRTLGAVLNFFLPGGDMYGGSTITQQLIKNVSGDDEATIQRKVQEIFRAINVESKFSKEQILEMYLNIIDFSQNCDGVKAAAQTYFGKELQELTLIECAALAAIPKSPTKYDPIRNPQYNLQRRNLVLKEMLAQGKISQEEFDGAYNQPLYLNTGSDDDGGGETVYSYFVDALIDNVTAKLMEEYSINLATASRMLYSGGLKIISTQNPLVQSSLEEVFTDESCFPAAEGIPPQAAMAVMDPHTGNVLGVVGGRGEKTVARGLNRAVQSKRQCGSSIKPLSIYALAIERGLLTYGTAVDDVPVYYYEDTGEFWPHNQPDQWYGMVSVSFAIQKSLNTVAVEVCGKTGSTNDDRDRYFVGYTPDFTASVWFGYDNNKSLGSFSYNPATRLWVEVFNRIYEKYDGEGLYYQTKFNRPSGIVEVAYCSISGKKPTEACKIDLQTVTTGKSVIEMGVFAVGEQPTEYCDCHVPAFYNTVTKQIVEDGEDENVIPVSLRSIPAREFWGRIYTSDIDYILRESQQKKPETSQ